MNMRNGLMAAAFAVLAVVAVAGWARKPSTAASAPALNTAGYIQSTYPQTSSRGAQPTYIDQNGQPVSGSASVVTNSTQPVSASEPCVPNGAYAGAYNSATYQPAVYSTPSPDDRYVSDRYARSIHRPVRIVRREYVSSDSVVRDNGYTSSTRREYVTSHAGRSKRKSVAIVAGSAAGGAAIGALAGGGKGAGIGALAGGGAGFIYDRLTHNHR